MQASVHATRPLAGGSPKSVHATGLQIKILSVAALKNQRDGPDECKHSPKAKRGSVASGCFPLVLVSASNSWLRHFNFAPRSGRQKACGLTLPSSGQLPAWPFQSPRSMVRLPGPSRQLPLMSNVRHRKAPVQQDRALKAKGSMPFKRSVSVRMNIERCELVVEAKH